MKYILLLIVFYTVSFGQSTEVLEKIQEKFRTVETFKADFSQQAMQGKNSKPSGFSGKFLYKKGNKFRAEFGNYLLISNGTDFWNLHKKEKKVIISTLSDEPSFFSFEKFILDYPDFLKSKVEKTKSGWKIKLQPDKGNYSFEHIYIFVDEGYMVESLEILNYNDTRFKIDLKNLITNVEIEEAEFSLIPSAGIKVIDLR